MSAGRASLPPGRRARSLTPATSANLGPGFDSLGLAWDWYDEIAVETVPSGTEIVVSGEGSAQIPRDETHLVVRTVRHGLDLLGAHTSGLRLTAVNTIPHSRGLGSSAAAIVAGLALAWALVHPDRELDRAWVLDHGNRIEGHPDNVAAAVHGGYTIAWLEEGTDELVARVVATRAHAELEGLIFLPDQELPTSHARGVLPTAVPLAEAAANSGRAALLTHALTRDPALLVPATRDWLHQDARTVQYPASMALVRALRADGLAAVISGAGPTVVVLGTRAELERAGDRISDGFRRVRHRPGVGVRIGSGPSDGPTTPIDVPGVGLGS